MNTNKVIVKRNCTYNDNLITVGTTLYISEPYNFGKRKIFDESGKLLAFTEIQWNDFEWNIGHK